MVSDLKWLDNPSYYATANLGEIYNAVGGGTTVNAGSGSRGGSTIRMTSILSSILKTMEAASATHVMGARVRWNFFTSYGYPIFRVMQNGTTECELTIGTDGSMRVTRAGVTLAGPFGSLAANAYNYLEFKLTQSNAAPAGSVQVHVNGAQVYSNAGVLDTFVTANANAFQMGPNSGGSMGATVIDIEDIYYGQGTDLLGDTRMDILNPTAEGNYSDFTPSAGTDNALNVDDATPNTTDYNESDVIGEIDSFIASNLSVGTGTIHAVAVCNYAWKTDAGLRTLAALIRNGGIDGLSAARALSMTPLMFQEIFATDPATAAAWANEAAVNSIEPGYKLVA